MAFAAHFGFSPTSPGALQAQQLLLTTKTSGSQSSPGLVDAGRGLLPGEGRGLLPGEGLPVSAAIPYLSRMTGLPESLYAQAAMVPSGAGIEPSAFYTLNGSTPAFSMDRSQELWKTLHHQSPVLYPFDPMLATHPYGAFYGGFDLNNAARRKNATRETTSALKAWLYEHRKNPYPTKGEKIMLAIITKMTLTQVSTWFANARRRLKKESKVGWGKDKDIDDNDDSDIDVDDRRMTDDSDDGEKDGVSAPSTRQYKESADEEDIRVTSDLSDISDTEDDKCLRSSPENSPLNQSKQVLPNFNRSTEASLFAPHRFLTSQPIVSRTAPTCTQSVSTNCANQILPKPKIWSIAEIVNASSKKTENSDMRTARECETVSNQNQRTSTSPSRDEGTHRTGCTSIHTQRSPSAEYQRARVESAQGMALNLSVTEKSDNLQESQSATQQKGSTNSS